MPSEKVDATVRHLLEAVAAMGAPPLDSMTPEEARLVAANRDPAVNGLPEDVASVEDLCIAGPAGDIPLRIYRAATDAPRPGLIFFHGGGWVLCGLSTHDVVCRALARRAGATVVSVDYRLAPEHQFPAAVEDAYAATLWVGENLERLGIDPARLSVGGDSAGGNLATVVTLLCRDQGGPAIASQALVYPVTDLGSLDTPSYEEFADGHSLTRSLMQWFRSHYLAKEEDGLHPHASPLRAANLSGLPPALILTAECDPLRDEGEAYALRLQQAGNAVTLQRYAGMIHPFFTLSGAIPQGMQAIEQVAQAVATASLATTPHPVEMSQIRT